MPQGYILGPLVFVIYINNIVNSSNILSFVLLADDTTVYVQHDSIDGAIQILSLELAKAAEWFDCNKLTLNVNQSGAGLSKVFTTLYLIVYLGTRATML